MSNFLANSVRSACAMALPIVLAACGSAAKSTASGEGGEQGGTAGSSFGRSDAATAAGGRGSADPARGGRAPTDASNGQGGRAGGDSARGGEGASGSTERATGGASAVDVRGGTHAGGAASTDGSGFGGRPRITAAAGATLVKINPSAKYQKFEGWGTSLCWWAYQIGGWSAAKRNEFLEWIVNPTTGLGYNVFRYNIGGGDDPTHDHMGQNRQMPGLQSSDGTWDWNADARQTAVLKQIAARAENAVFEAFSNSPPYFMTKSGCASGNTDGSNNLKDDSYGKFADYLTEVVKHYRDELGIPFRTLEPMNEPNANWWKAKGGQEGCHFGASSQQQIIKEVGSKLQSKGLTGTQISASDENSMDDAYTILGGYDSATLSYLAQMNVHSYAGSRRAELSKLAAAKGKRLWQSESGPLSVTLDTNLDAAIFMAGRIITDLRELKPAAWIEWQVVDPGAAWTSFTVNDSKETWTPVKRFYSQAAFSRYIRPGATFVDVDSTNMVAALAGDEGSLTLVVRNDDKTASKSFTFDLTGFATVGASVEVYRTSESEDLAHLSPIDIERWSFTASAAPYSVTAYVIALGS